MQVERFTVFSLITTLLNFMELKQSPWGILSTGNDVFFKDLISEHVKPITPDLLLLYHISAKNDEN
jgi:hypothetical protein